MAHQHLHGQSLMNKKKAYLFCKFLDVEMRKIDEDKYYEGVRRHCDPGQEYVIDWIQRNADNWRKEWDASCCQHCDSWKTCGQNVKEKCESFKFDEKENEESSE